jgi:predicted signal transduction protein with EAL and GGDEF domain
MKSISRSLARDLGTEVVAEGAETESDAIELYQLGRKAMPSTIRSARWKRELVGAAAAAE